MTNTHITVGGHKITTNKVGQVHYVTTLLNGATGIVSWCVVNGWCNVFLSGVATGSSFTKIAEGLPKAKLAGQNQNGNGDAYVGTGNTNLYAVTFTGAMYFSFTYPVADDWVES